MSTLTEIEILHQAIDASWEPGAPAQSSLSILFSSQHCVGTIFDKNMQKFVFLKSFYQEGGLQEFLNPEWLRENFSYISQIPVTFSFSFDKTTLVPDALYNPDLKADFLKLNHGTNDDEKIESVHLKNLQARLIFSEDVPEMKALLDAFPGSSINHSCAGWLENISLQYKNTDSDHFHIDFEDNKLDIAFFRAGSLHLFNSFQCETDEDKLYYPLFISEQLRINPKKDNYYLSGIIEKESATYRLFSKYIKNLHLQARPMQFKYSLPLTALPEHLYYKSFSSPVCV